MCYNLAMHLFILGRQPEIGLAELRAVFGDAKLITPTVALVPGEMVPNIDRLGSVRKSGRVIWDQPGEVGKFLIDKLEKLPPGKITLGISHYGKTASAASARKTAAFLKKNLARSVRFLPNSAAEIADAATLGNKLGSSPNKIELLMVYAGHRVIIAELTGVQNLNSYTLRDRGRPKRDARVGMLPPKLAQTMINLAVGAGISPKLSSEDFLPSDSETYIPDATDRFVFASEKNKIKDGSAGLPAYDVSGADGSSEKTVLVKSGRTEKSFHAVVLGRPGTLLDPFCGTGVILQEAALMGYQVYGTDIEPRMISYSGKNLQWLASKFPNATVQNLPTQLAVGDATQFNWKQWMRKTSDRHCEAPAEAIQKNSLDRHDDKSSRDDNLINLVVTETYLGQPYTTAPPTEKLQQNITTCNTIISKFLISLASQITPKTGLCVAVPCWFLTHRTFHLPLVGTLTALGYEQIFYSEVHPKPQTSAVATTSRAGSALTSGGGVATEPRDDGREGVVRESSAASAGKAISQTSLIYHRENQIVGRELLVLRKKS